MYITEAMATLPWLVQCLIRLAVSALLGGAIGLERERRVRDAGFRTQMLVALGAGVVMIAGLHFVRLYGDNVALVGVRVDPTRAAFGVMTGVGFLGAGTIISHGATVRGLTTATSLWCTAAVGITTGLGLFELAACTTVIVLIVLYFLSWIDRRIPSRWDRTVEITLDTDAPDAGLPMRRALASAGISVRAWGLSHDSAAGRQTTTLYVCFAKASPEDLLRVLGGIEGVSRLSVT